MSKLIDRRGGNVSALQLIGFILMLFGIITLIVSSFYNCAIIPSVISIAFFITMLGFSFAFPSLLEGNDGLSTMRIVVFMMTNVICMLLLKIGWGSAIASLKEIGLDQYWMGVIAFVFGAKATQSFFESKMAVPDTTPTQGMAAVQYTNADIAKLAVAQNEQYLNVKFPNILSISDAVHDLSQTDSHVIALYLKDNNTAGIPDILEVKMPDGTIKTISTEIVKGLSGSKIHVCQGDKIKTVNDNFFGSVCCLVKSLDDENFMGIVTAGHIYTDGACINKGGILKAIDQTAVSVNEIELGKWVFQLIINGQDLAIAKLNNANQGSCMSFDQTGYDIISDGDVKICKVTLVSNKSGTRTGYVLDYGLGFPVPYDDGTSKYMANIILIGSTNDRQTSTTVSQPGDSGGCVYNTSTKQLIGLILGGDAKFTYVLPLKDTLDSWNYKPL